MQILLKYLNKALILFGFVCLSIMVSMSFLQVIMRYVFSYALPWPEELCRFMFIGAAYVGIAMTMFQNKHLCVDLLATFTPRSVANCLKILSLTCTALFTILLGYLSYEMIFEVKEMNYMASSMPVPIYITWIPIPICIWLTSLYSILNIAEIIKNKNTI